MIADRVYRRLPDGSVLDFNHVFDAIDQALAPEKPDPMRSTKRFLYQYRDAIRNQKVVEERYEYVKDRLIHSDKMDLKDPTSRLDIVDGSAAEGAELRELLAEADKECAAARKRVAAAVCSLKDEKAQIVITAHYICEADLKWISAVYGYRSYWAKEVRDKALTELSVSRSTNRASGNTADLERLISKWNEDEARYKAAIAREPARAPLNDNLMLMGLT